MTSLGAKFAWNADVRKNFYLKLAEKIENGVAPLDVITKLHDRASSRGQKGLASVYRAMVQDMKSGEPLVNVLTRSAPGVEAMLLQGLDGAKDPSGILRETVATIEQIGLITKAMRAGIMKPLVYFFLVFVVLIFYRVEVLPEMSKSLDVNRWEGATRALWDISSFVYGNILIIGVALAALGGVIYWSFDNYIGPGRDFLDKLPPWSIHRIKSGAIMMLTVSSLQASGRDAETALVSIRDHAGAYIRVKIDPIIRELRGGVGNIGMAIIESKQTFPNREFVDDMEDYSSSPKFPEILQRISKSFLMTGIVRIERIAEMSAKFGMLFVYLTVALVVFGLFGFTFSIVGSAR